MRIIHFMETFWPLIGGREVLIEKLCLQAVVKAISNQIVERSSGIKIREIRVLNLQRRITELVL